MRLWFSPGSDVPIYKQLGTQVVLAILCGDLKPGEKLPSTRALARRFAIHPNTVSAGYHQLELEGWVESRRGSGVYVKQRPEERSTPEQILDCHIAGFFRAVRELGLPAETVRAQVARWLAAPPPDHFLLIDPDTKLRQILVTELRAATKLPVKDCLPEECASSAMLTGALPLCRPSRKLAVREALPAGVELLTLPINSAIAWLAPLVSSAPGHLIAVVSHWPEFVETARTMLLAAGIAPEALMFREAGAGEWRRGLDAASAILCDSYTATLALPKKPRRFVFPLLADTVGEMLKTYDSV